jgi:hypothetical protein
MGFFASFKKGLQGAKAARGPRTIRGGRELNLNVR